jgi:hypothetical protein
MQWDNLTLTFMHTTVKNSYILPVDLEVCTGLTRKRIYERIPFSLTQEGSVSDGITDDNDDDV